MNTLRPLGWLKQPDDARDHDAVNLLRAAPPVPVPDSVPRSTFIKDDLDQLHLGSCTANGAGQAVYAAQVCELIEQAKVAWSASGKDSSQFDFALAVVEAKKVAIFWSRLFMYFLARAYEGTIKEDGGANIRDIFKSANKFGYPSETTWPYSDSTDPKAPFSQMPSAAAFREAYDQRASAENINANVVDYALIREVGTDRINVIKQAVAQGHLVVFGTQVTHHFCSDMTANNGQPIPPPSPSDPIAGGHCMAIGGYDEDGADVLNSWSKRYGQNGWCRFSWEYITWFETTDLWIVRRAPILAKAG